MKSISNGALFELKRTLSPSMTTTDLIQERLNAFREEIMAEVRECVRQELQEVAKELCVETDETQDS